MDPVTLFEPEFARRALLATLCIAVAGGLLGTTVVLRDLPFFAHAVGSGAYPALVAGAIWGWQPHLAGFAGAIAFAGLLWLTTRGRGAEPRVRDTRTGLVVAAALAGGAVLARAFAGDAPLTVNPEAMLFGSVLTVSSEALTTAFAIAAVAIVAVFARGDQWLATGFDRGAARGLGVAGHDFSMLLVVALAVAAALPLTGALMAGALLVIPAATARMLTRRTTAMTIASVLVAVGTGVSGLYVSLAFDLPAGASIAATASAVFVLTALGATVAPLVSRHWRTATPATVLLVLVFAVAGCGSDSDSMTGNNQSGDALAIVATTTQIADLARQIGGDHVQVTTLLKAGADPHEYEPTPSDVASLESARVVFKNGGEIDSWLQPAIAATGSSIKPIDLADGAVLRPPGAPGDDGSVPADAHEAFNAHWSLDPDNLRSVALLVRDELIKADPARRETYRARAAAYRSSVIAADKRLRICVKTVPAPNRTIVAGHDDFIYLTEHFRIETAALLRANGHDEPSAADVERATGDARAGDAQAMIVSKGEAGRLDEAIADELGVPLLELYGDSLAAEGDASTALGAIGYNVRRIVGAAGGEAAGCGEAV